GAELVLRQRYRRGEWGRLRCGAVSRRARIVGPVGPATASTQKVRELVDAGMDVARMTFSHGNHDDHRHSYGLVRDAARESGRPVGILADLQGPKIRLETFAGGST